jgi:hypothetical protein
VVDHRPKLATRSQHPVRLAESRGGVRRVMKDTPRIDDVKRPVRKRQCLCVAYHQLRDQFPEDQALLGQLDCRRREVDVSMAKLRSPLVATKSSHPSELFQPFVGLVCPPFERASFMRKDSPWVATTTA